MGFFSGTSPRDRMKTRSGVSANTPDCDLVVLALGAFLAWRNFRAKRGDIRGANRVAAFVFAAAWLSLLLDAHHVAAVEELGVLIYGTLITVITVLPAASIWALYLAFEPYVC
jgi:hypothetical protein